jgi:hypothetical protein
MSSCSPTFSASRRGNAEMSGSDITSEGKAVLAANMRRRWGEKRQQMMDAVNEPQGRRRRSEAFRRRWTDPTERAKLLAARSAPDAVAKRSASLTAYYADPANTARHSVAVAEAQAARTREQRAEQSVRISEGMMAAPPEERRERAVRAARTMRAPSHPPKATPEEKKRRLIAELLASETPPLEAPKNPVVLATRRFGEAPVTDVDFSSLPVATDEPPPAQKGTPGKPKGTPWRTPFVSDCAT